MNWSREPSSPNRPSATTTWPRPWSPSPRRAQSSQTRYVIDYMSSQTENVASGEEPAVRCLQECGRGKEKLMEGECWAKQINFLCSFYPESVQLELKLYVEPCSSQVISSIEQKTEGSEKKQQLAKEYREKASLACCFYKYKTIAECSSALAPRPNMGIGARSVIKSILVYN